MVLRHSPGKGEGSLITTPGTTGLLDWGEVRQITHDAAGGWELHQNGLDFIAANGIESGDQIGNGLDDFLVWLRAQSRAALRRFPVGLLAGFFRPIFHFGPLRKRRGARRQLRRFT